jgi:tetratricopeptide (TPR) repeat protein
MIMKLSWRALQESKYCDHSFIMMLKFQHNYARKLIRSLSMVPPSLKVALDITQSPFSYSAQLPVKQLMGLLDESIMHCISMDQCPLQPLDELIKLDKYCTMAHLILVFHYLRRSRYRNSNNDSVLINSLGILKKMKQAKLFNLRESFLFEGAELWMRGLYLESGRALEAGLALHPTCLISMRLAQDVYLHAGDAYKAMRCSLRTSHAFNDKNILYAYYLGIVTIGYLEADKLHLTEEFGNRAIEKCKGQDLGSLKALMSSLLMQGRSSECTGLLDYHSDKHEKSSALVEMIYIKSRAFIQRGNYSGALRKFDEMLMEIDKLECDAPMLTLPTTLLWIIHLNSQNYDLTGRFYDLMTRWNYVVNQDYILSPALLMSCAMAHAGACHYSYNPPVIEESTSDPVKSPTFMQSIQQSLSWVEMPKKAEKKDTIIASEAQMPELISFADKNKMCDEFYAKLQSISELKIEPRSKEAGSIQRIPEAPIDCSDRVWAVKSAVLPLSIAIRAFMSGDFSQSYLGLLDLQPVWRRVGGSVLERDVIEQTLIEACMRSGRLEDTQRLLCERVALVPNDSQSWRRLAGIHGGLGQDEEARGAHYTAWQLGIGQGGFGGPK